MSRLLLSFYGDDFTGSTDALEFLTRAGARTVLFIEPPTPAQLECYPGLQALGVAGMTRGMTPDAMEAELRPALTKLRTLGTSHVHYKVCSTFDSSPAVGSIGRVIDVAAGIFGADFVPLLVGAPPLGRYCVFGNLFARMGIGSDGAIHRLDRHPSMSRHPVTPADESDLRLHLAKQTGKRIGLFDLLQIELPRAEARAELQRIVGDGAEVVLFDVLYPSHLERLGRLIDDYASQERPLFSVGSSGVEMALGAHWSAQGRLKPPANWEEAGSADRLLVLSGSCSPVTEGQIEWALGRGFVEVPLDTESLAKADGGSDPATRGTIEAAVRQLQSGRSVIVHTSRGIADPRVGKTSEVLGRRGGGATAARILGASLLGAALGKVAREAVRQTGLRRLCIAGGDTSGFVARELGIEAMEMQAPLAPGAPLCRMYAPGSAADGLTVNFKGGQVGGPDYFETVLDGKAQTRGADALQLSTEQ